MRLAAILLLVTSPVIAQAQDPPVDDPPTQSATGASIVPGEALTEFDPVRVTAPRPAVEDPFAFRNPVQVDDTAFNRSWREPVSAESVGMQGGIVALAIGYAIQKSAEGIRKLPGWKLQIEPATARPPPLQDEHMQRILRLQDGETEADQAMSNPSGNSAPDGPS